jgi:hypothetical protein
MEAQKNSLATISRPQTSKQPASSSDAIRQFLVKAGEVYNRQITPPLVTIWIESLAGYPVETLQGLFRLVFMNCKFFPTPADVLEPMKKAEEAGAPLAAERKWHDVLEYCRLYITPDIPIPARAPKIGERTMTAIRAAGGLQWIESCSRDALVWAKKAFIESYTAWDMFKRGEHLLPDGPVKNLIAGVAGSKMLPPSK